MRVRGEQRRGWKLVGAWPTALLGLRSHPVVAALLAATFAAATAGALIGLQSGLTLLPRPGEDPGLAWSTAVQLPMETRQHAVNTLAAMLLAAALATLSVAVVTIVALSAAREARHAATISVQRAVGASRRTLLAAALLEAGLLVTAGRCGVSCRESWPGSHRGIRRWF